MRRSYWKALYFIIIIFISFKMFGASLELYGNYHTMGVIVTLVEGEDSENDAVANIKYRLLGDDFKDGFPATRTNNTQFIGSLFWLEPGNTYEVEVTIIDPTSPDLNGAKLKMILDTRNNPKSFEATKSYFVSPNGTGDIFSKDNPGKIEDAVMVVKGGEEIVMLGGIYYSGVMDFGFQGNKHAPITVRSAKGEMAILDGSDPSSFSWENEGDEIYSTTLNVENTKLVMAKGRRLYEYNSYDDLKDLTWNLNGFFVDGNKLFVKLKGDNPNNVEMIISKMNTGFTIWQRSYFHFRNLTFRYYGQGNWAKAIYFYDSNNNVVDSCVFAFNNLGVGIKYNSNQITVQNSEFYDDTDMWDWNAMKASIVESTLISFYDPMIGRGHVIRNNVFHDCQDGLALGSFYQQELSNEIDIYNNTIYNAGDDGISVDGWASNVRVWNNTIHDVLVGISFAPIVKGPAYAIRNTIYDTGYGNSEYRGMSFKFNSGYDKSGKMYLFHNTVDADEIEGVDGFECRIPGDWELIYTRNNAFSGNRYAVSYIEGSGNRPLDMDFDNLFTSDSSLFSYWYDNQSRYYNTFAEFQNKTNLEKNGLNQNPMFESPESGDFNLKEDSPLIDAGVIIKGINDSFKGNKPDIGAIEMDNSVYTKDVKLEKEINKLKVYPNPANLGLNVELKDESDKIVLVNLYDISSRKIISKRNHEDKIVNINVSNQFAGVYNLFVYTKSGKTYRKIFIIN